MQTIIVRRKAPKTLLKFVKLHAAKLVFGCLSLVFFITSKKTCLFWFVVCFNICQFFSVHPGHTYPDLMGLITYDSFIQHLRHPHADLLVLIHMIPYALLDQIIDF